MDKTVVMSRGTKANLPTTGDSNVLYFSQDTAELFKSHVDGGKLLPYSGIVGIYDTKVDMEASVKIEGKFYILKEEEKYSIYMYDRVKGFFPITAKADGGDLGLSQKTKLNVIATKEEPYVLPIPINYTSDFLVAPIEVLKMAGEEGTDVTEILADFDNTDRDDFMPNEYVEMDGTMRIKTDWEYECEVINKAQGIYSFDTAKLKDLKVLKSLDII